MKQALQTILLAGIVAGILDGISAVMILGKMNFAGVWKYVASGFFGNDAFAGGNEMVMYGLLFHFIIALSWAITYYLVFAKINFFSNHPILGGLLFGILIWLVMAFLVLPFSAIPKRTFSVIGAIKNAAILMLCVGLPISIITNKLGKR